jgi:hypothetical protein
MQETKNQVNKPLLTRSSLWDAIDKYLNSGEDSKQSKINDRYRYRMSPVLNDLYHPLMWNIDLSKKEPSEKQREQQVAQFIKAKSVLMTYTYYLQSCPQFSYLWSYLLKKIESFEHFLITYEAFIDKFIKDINTLHQLIRCNPDDLCFGVNGFLRIRAPKDQILTIDMDFEKLSLSLQKCCAKNYSLSVILGNTTLGVFNINENDELQPIAENIDAMITKGTHIYG